MKFIWTVFIKELIDSLRDRRTLITMVIIPLFLFPVLIGISSKVIFSQHQKEREKSLKVGLLTHGNAENFQQTLETRKDIKIYDGLSLETCIALIKSDSLVACFEFDPHFDENVRALSKGHVTVYHKATESREIEKKRLMDLLDDFQKELRSERFENLNLDVTIIETIQVSELNLATPKERVADVIGGFLPYLFILFCFMGSMYPAIDLAAGEKERGTLETLLTSPVGKGQILTGKFGVVVLTGTFSAAVSILGLYIGIRQVKEIPPELLHTLLQIVELKSIGLILSLLVPLTVFFGAFQLALSIYAKSFKEAQNLINPFMVVVIVPAFMGLLPGVELNSVTALIPIMNVSLATKAIIAGSIRTLLLLEVYGSLLFFGGVSIFICTRVFGRESAIFRG